MVFPAVLEVFDWLSAIMRLLTLDAEAATGKSSVSCTLYSLGNACAEGKEDYSKRYKHTLMLREEKAKNESASVTETVLFVLMRRY